MAAATRGLDAARRATVRVCGADGAHVGQGLLQALPDGDVVVLTCHHVVAPLGADGVHVALRQVGGGFGPPIPARYDGERSHPDHDAAVLRLGADPDPGRSQPLLHALEQPEDFAGSLLAVGIAYHAQADTFGGWIEAGATMLPVLAREGGRLPDTPAAYVLPFAYRLAGVGDASEGTSGAVVVCEDGVLGLAHFARGEKVATARESYVVPLSVWAEEWPALAGLIESLHLGQPDPERALEAARRKLAALPTEAIPPPTSLPSGSRMPLSPNPLFVGRDADLRALAMTLKGGETAAVVPTVAATGLGGIGKTQLAAEFVHRYGSYFAGGVFWLSFADAAAVSAEVAACGRVGTGGVRPIEPGEGFDELKLEEQVARVWAVWRPPSGGGRVLVTSRRGGWSPALGVRPVALGVLAREDSVALLRGYLGDIAATEHDLAAIAAAIGDLPLALHLAGSYLAQYGRDVLPGRYLAQLRGPSPIARLALGAAEGPSPTGHEQSVAGTFALSYERLRPADSIDAVARALLARAAYFAPGEPIPRPLLMATLPAAGDDDVAREQRAKVLRRLVELGLLEEEVAGALRLHRLLAAHLAATWATHSSSDGGRKNAVLAGLVDQCSLW